MYGELFDYSSMYICDRLKLEKTTRDETARELLRAACVVDFCDTVSDLKIQTQVKPDIIHRQYQLYMCKYQALSSALGNSWLSASKRVLVVSHKHASLQAGS